MRRSGSSRLGVVVAACAATLGLAASARPASTQTAASPAGDAVKAALMREGADLFAVECTTCHAPDGAVDQAPALAGNTAIGSTEFVVSRLLKGTKEMPSFAPTFSDRQIAAVSTYIRNAWGNAHGVVLETDVARFRAAASAKSASQGSMP